MGLLDDIKNKVDQNGDNKLSKDDLDSLKDGSNDGVLDKLKSIADQNEDGRVSFDDIKKIDLGSTFEDIKNKLF